MKRRLFNSTIFAVCLAACLACDRRAEHTTIALGGDVMFGRWHDGKFRPHHQAQVLEELGRLDRADFAAVNLETALCEPAVAQQARLSKGHVQLTAPPSVAQTLRDAGADLVSVANNHALDCGQASVEQTSSWLARRGIAAAGRAPADDATSLPAVEISLAKMRLQVLAATTVMPARVAGRLAEVPCVVTPDRFDELVAQVARVRKARSADLIIVSVHWGTEYAPQPGRWQVDRAHDLVDAGADVIWGHGSHTVQRVERYRGGVIAYGLGNLHFDMRHPATSARQLLELAYEAQPGRRPALRRAALVDVTSHKASHKASHKKAPPRP